MRGGADGPPFWAGPGHRRGSSWTPALRPSRHLRLVYKAVREGEPGALSWRGCRGAGHVGCAVPLPASTQGKADVGSGAPAGNGAKAASGTGSAEDARNRVTLRPHARPRKQDVPKKETPRPGPYPRSHLGCCSPRSRCPGCCQGRPRPPAPGTSCSAFSQTEGECGRKDRDPSEAPKEK